MSDLRFTSAEEWESWLELNHSSMGEAWLVIAKKGSAEPGLSIREALDGALCFGSIDGQRTGLDGGSYRQRYCPRRARSTWSQVNVERALWLMAEGRMRPAGLTQIDAARADGRWDAAYASQAEFVVPVDVDPALLDGLNRTERYLAVLPILKARTPKTREAAITRLRDRASGRLP